MAHYKNQSDMFTKRAEKCKKDGDRFYAQAMKAKEEGNKEKSAEYMAQAQHYYKAQKENEQKAIANAGKEWDGTSTAD